MSVQAQVPGYVPTTGLVGWWPFNGNANDESGNANDGSVDNAALVPDRSGNPNSAFLFNGVDSRIVIGDPANGDLDMLGGPLSISLWVLTTESALSSLVTKQNTAIPNSSGDYNLDMNASGQARMAMGFGGGQGEARVSNTLVNDGAWHHVVAIYSPNSIDLYVDGVLATSGSNSISAPLVLLDSPQPLQFGIAVPDTTPHNGRLDDIGIWNRALSDAEVTGLYTGSGVGVAESLTASPELRVFPNPSNGSFLLEHSLSGRIDLRIVDITGREVYLDVLRAFGGRTQHALDLTGLAKGTYLIELRHSGGTIEQRIVVE